VTVLALLSAGAYLATLCPTVFWYDSAEYSALAPVLGLPHPPGSPLYVWVGHAATRLLPVEAALAMNALSAAAGVLCVALLYGAARAIGLGAAASAVAAASLGASRVFWSNATIAESYLPGLAFALAALWLLCAGLRRADPDRAPLAALVAGLGLAVHLSIATLGAGFAWLALAAAARAEAVHRVADLGTRRVVAALGRIALRCAVALAGALCVWLWIPLRDPARAGSLAHWQWSWMIATGGTFWQNFDDPSLPAASLAATLAHLPAQFGSAGVALAALGAAWMLARGRLAVGVGLALGWAGNLWFFHRYRVHDAEVFFLPAYAVTALWIGAGCEALAAGAARRAGRPRAATALASLGLLLPALLAWRNAPQVDRSEQRDAARYGRALVASLPPDAALVKFDHHDEWKRYGVLLYFQHALGERRDLRVYTNPSEPFLRCRFETGQPLFAFQPVPRLEALGYALRAEGPAWRLAARHGVEAPPPRAREDAVPPCVERIRR